MPIPDYVINDEVRAFVLTDAGRFIIFDNGDYEYLVVVGDLNLREREVKWLEEWREELASNGLEVPASFREENDELRFLMSHNNVFWEIWNAMAHYEDYLLNYQAHIFDAYEDFKEYLEAGLVYGYRRDKQQRPTIIYNIRKVTDYGLNMDKFLDFVDFFCSYTQYHAMVPGVVETWNVIIDNTDVALYEFPISSLGGMAKRTKASFKVRCNHIVSANTNWFIAKASKFIKKVVDPRAAGKVFIFSKDYFPHLDELIGRENLEEKFGGDLPNKTTDFWPPRYN